MTSKSLEPENLERQLRFACGELNRRLRAGESCTSEELLASFPELVTKSDLAMELIYTEFLIRQQLNQPIIPQQWFDRFPQWKDDLRQLFDVHEAVCDDELSASRRPGDSSFRSGSRDSQSRTRRSDRPQLAPLKRVGNYELLEEIGRGGMGVVYRARQIGLNRIVAVKMILGGEHASSGELARFRKEAESAARLQHPGIVQIHEVGTHDGLPYFSMESVEGGNLQTYLVENGEGRSTRSADSARNAAGARDVSADARSSSTEHSSKDSTDRRDRRQGRLAPETAARLIETLARTVHYAHQQGVIHRDLKPANVLLPNQTSRDLAGGGERTSGKSGSDIVFAASGPLAPKITDFGLAKTLSDGEHDRTRSGAMLGTPAYMAPEQALGKRGYMGPATDVYALGAILYELLTGQPAFHGSNWLETLEQVRQREPIRPSRLVSNLPRDLQTICLKCLEKEPARRYATAELLAEDLERFLKGEPIHAEVISTTERMVKWARRRPAVAALAVTVAVVALLGFTGVVWQWREAENRRETVELALYEAERAKVEAQRQQKQALAQKLEADRARQAAESEEEKARRRMYFHRVAQAQAEIQNFQVGHADQLLEQCPSDYRHWEWNYLKTLCHSDQFVMHGHSEWVHNVAYSPDGKFIASGSGRWYTEHLGEVIIWNAETGQPVFPPLKGHAGSIMGLAFSPDGKTLISCAAGWGMVGPGRVIAWNVETGEERFRLPVPDGKSGTRVAFSPDGQMFAVAHWDGKIRFWNAANGKLLGVLPGHNGAAFDVSFHPNGKWLASVGRDGAAYVWDIQTKKPVHEFLGYGDLRLGRISPDGRHFVFTTFAQRLHVWNITQPTAVQVATHLNRGGVITAIDFASEGRRLAICAQDGGVKIIDFLLGDEVKDLRVHNGMVVDAKFSPDGGQLATVGIDRTVRISDVTTETNADLISANRAHFRSAVFTPDGSRLLLASSANKSHPTLGSKALVVWNIAESRMEREILGHNGWLSDVACARNGTRYVTTSDDRTARVWNAATGTPVAIFQQHSAAVTCVTLDPTDTWATTGSADRTLCTWHVESGELRRMRRGHSGKINTVAQSADGHCIASGADDCTIRLWFDDDSEPRFVLEGHAAPITRLAFRPGADPNWLASASEDGTVRLWNTATGELRSVFRGHAGVVSSVAFSPDGNRMATTSDDWTVRLWNVQPADEILTFVGQVSSLLCVAFSPDGQTLAAVNQLGVKMLGAQRRPQRPAESQAYVDANADWHRRAAVECEMAKQWDTAQFHVSRLAKLTPDDPALLTHQAYLLTQFDDPSAADQAYQASLRAIEKANSHFHEGAVLALARGRVDDYRDLCQLAIKKLEPQSDVGLYNDTLWLCCLAESPEVNIVPMIETFRQLIPQTKGRQQAFYWNTLGVALYRTGQYQEAIEMLQKSTATLGGGGLFEDWVFLAMAYHRVGRTAEARTWADKADQWLRERGDRVANISASTMAEWDYRVVRELHLREARKLAAAK